MQFIGYFLAFCAMVFAIYYSFTRKITFKKGAVTSLIILFISLIFIFDEITVEGIGLLRKARS
ncbi:MAG: hypothetical protein HOG24_09250, partial [Candidatus Cloacimonetes bacterium]|nr:hypothetical protein [Candidatus Cloacimonadota bacterium]